MTDRSRRSLLAALAATAAGVGLAACGDAQAPGPGGSPSPGGASGATDSPSPSGGTGSPDPSESSTAEPTAPSSSSASSSPPRSDTPCADELSMEQRIGQLMVMGVNSSGATAGQLDILSSTHAGAVIMMGNYSGGRDGTRTVTDEMRSAARQGDGVDLLVTTDQEGGLVQRLTGPGLDTIPAAATQATWSTSKLRENAKRWGTQLKAAGVDSSMSPVADVVPPEIGKANEPIAATNRGYGSDPDEVADKVVAVVKGLRAGGLATALKHFPGLGQVTGNTDFVDKVVDDRTTADDPLLAPFGAGIKAGTDMVMAATAIYSKIDADHVAALSPVVIEKVLRGRFGWSGVVVSDDLGVAKAVTHLSPGERALGFLRAGGDLIINVDPASVTAMVEAIAAEASSDDEFAATISAKAERVLRMKAGRGLATCTSG